MKYNELIDNLMPLVQEASDKPCIVWRKGDSWNMDSVPTEKIVSHLERIKDEYDPYAITVTGADFSRGSFPFVFDNVLISRLRAEYDTLNYGATTLMEFDAVMNFIEDNLIDISPEAADYLANLNRPLFELNEMKPFSMRDEKSDLGYDENRVDDFIDLIENHVQKSLEKPVEKQKDKPSLLKKLDDNKKKIVAQAHERKEMPKKRSDLEVT